MGKRGSTVDVADSVADPSTGLTRESFLICLQDPDVQRIMDDLDIPPDRAHLFDVLDADNSGEVMTTEFVNGLLKLRGEPRRSDGVATWLAVRALQSQFHEFQSMVCENQRDMLVCLD